MQQVFYNGTALNTLGKVVILSQTVMGEPPASPERWRRTVVLRLNFHQPDYGSNFALVRQVEALVKIQQATLKWTDTDTAAVWIERPAELAGHDWPENPNALGTYHQSLTLTFVVYENLLESEHQALGATFQRTGQSTIVQLEMIESVKIERDVRRYHEMRDNRSKVTRKISLRGRIRSDPTLALAARRAAILATSDQLAAEIGEGVSGRLIYATTDQTVRVETFVADIDQARWDIGWSMSATYTEFPNEAGYAEAEFTIATREDRAMNEIIRTFSGRIAAESEVAAQSKLLALRTALMDPDLWVATKLEQTSAQASGADGSAFFELTFSEEHRRKVQEIVQSRLSVQESSDADSGLIKSVWSGSVTASGSSHAVAYGHALARCRALGNRKYQFQVSAVETTEDPTLGTSGAPIAPVTTWTSDGSPRINSPQSLVTVTFAYEYRRKGTRTRINLATKLSVDQFGANTTSVTGSIVATTNDAALVIYNTVIRAAFATSLIRNESYSQVEEQINDLSGETPLATYTTLPIRLEFGFDVHSPKIAGKHSAKYDITVSQDLVSRTQTTTVSGTAFGDTLIATSDWLATLLGLLGYVNPVSTRRSESREKAKRGDNEDYVEEFIALGFDNTYITAISGDGLILQCELTEDLECSGNRVVPQPTATGKDVIQNLDSIQSGRRTITGSVLATDETTAVDWVRHHLMMPFNASIYASATLGVLPHKISFTPEAVPFSDLVIRTGAFQTGTREGNAKCVRCRFTFSTIYQELSLL